MKKALPLLILTAFVLFSSHDMFLKLDGYFLEPNTEATIELYNGTFDRSDNVIDRNRMIDVSLVGNGERTAVDSTQWTERDSTTLLNFTTGEPGTYVVGVSTRARNIEMDAEAFNGYLEHDGVLDVLADREANGTLDQSAVEKYSKHVKTLFQVGGKVTGDWQTKLGYPIEFVPLANPYDLHLGDNLSVQLLRDGQPLADQLVYVGAPAGHSHDHDEDHSHDHDHDETGEDHSHHADAQQYQTDQYGIVNIDLASEGVWYLRTINLVESDKPGLTHESNWATLTFEMGHGHDHDQAAHTHGDHSHDHDHEHEGGIPAYAYWLVSLALVGGLFFWFNRKA